MKQLSSKNSLSISNFTFERLENKLWAVRFFSTKTKRSCSTVLFDSEVNNIGYAPKQKDLITLKKLCKNGNN